MYLTFDQVILVSDKRQLPTDRIVYERELAGQRILTPDGEPNRFASEAKRYGTLYFDVNDQPCIIPDVFSMEDALVAKSWR